MVSPYTVVDWRSPGTSTPSIASEEIVHTNELVSDMEPVVVIAAMAIPVVETSTIAIPMAIVRTLMFLII
ncbi:hypothetical protein ASZ90_015271 [hydrocarbon metagenome]|uniref:Uncharacterized protein n=1 Tax=hydrocarbon metagenome TaxID=938273 RepID=A0A0W8F3V5_9ZZZZ